MLYYCTAKNTNLPMRTKLLLLLLISSLSTLAQTLPSSVPANGLIAYYPFNGNANDVSTNKSNGTVFNAALTSDRFGNKDSAYSFNGKDSYINAFIPNIPQGNSPRTISGWFKTDNVFSDPNKFETCILNYGAVEKLKRLSLNIYSKGYLETVTGPYFSSTEGFYVNNFNYANNDWYFFTLTYNGTKLSLYVNGQFVDEQALNLNTTAINNLFRIGQRLPDIENEAFKGTIDDIGIWNRVLTPEEISAMYIPGEQLPIYTLIPDPRFEEKLINLGLDRGVVDGKILTSNINTLNSLDVSNSNISDLTGIEDFTALETLICAGTIYSTGDGGNGKLKTLNVSKNLNLKTLDCIANQLTNLDVSNNVHLTTLKIAGNKISELDLSKNLSLNHLKFDSTLITEIDVSKNLSLTTLDCSYSRLTSLNISKNTALVYLNSSGLNLTRLDVSNNITLQTLYCQSNLLTSLDLSKNIALINFDCSLNLLKNLNLKNGFNSLRYVDFRNNPDLTCIQVDNVVYANANWANNKDKDANYDTNCAYHYTEIPDSNFEQKLIDLGIDTDGLNGKITTANISSITSLDLSNSNIKNLTGIEYFTSLTYLDVSNNQITSLDLSGNLFLETLNASSNQLTTLDVSINTKLRIVYVVNNPLVSLNLRNGNNANFILPSNTGKKSVSALYTSFLGLKTLGCIQVDNENYSNANWSSIKESTTTYSNTCKNLGVNESVFSQAVVYPNPTKGELNIKNVNLEKANVYNTLGQLVKSFKLNSDIKDNNINLSGLPKGVYYIYLINENSATVKKVIVE